MAIRIKLPRRKAPAARGKSRGKKHHLSLHDPLVKYAVASFIIVSTLVFGVFAYYYIKYQKIVDQRMRGQIFANASKIYAAPKMLRVGDKVDPKWVANELRRAGYTELGEQGESPLGTYKLQEGGIEVRPGPQSYHSADGALIHMGGDEKIDRISGLGSQAKQRLTAYELEPQLVTGLFDNQQRSKRRLVSYDDLPKSLVDAVVAIEDRRFFQHSGINYFRFAQAALINLREGRHAQGGSTLTMQIARGFFLTPEKTPKRKLTEMLIALNVEQRFSKKQIFELYANQIPMGQRGTFAIYGLGEAAQAYFAKDVKELTLTESALLAAIIQRPSYLSPYRHPERAMNRRNLVLDAMVETGAITKDEAEKAKAMPLKLAPPNVEASDAPYFVDMVKETLLSRYSEDELNESGYRVYTTIDPDLQRAAAEAVEEGLKLVDEQVRKQRTRKKKVGKKTETYVVNGPEPQVALIALDPQTGEVRALVGGRNYGMSQLNHALARRPTGSIFKPFVFAAAMNSAVEGAPSIITPASLLVDEPTTFIDGDKIYEPRNYKQEYHGQVTARKALALSLNNATVRLAELVGFDKVAGLARSAGIKSVKATPALALGAYDATPLDMAGAYTVFANNGVHVSPILLRSVRDTKGDVIEEFQPQKRAVLDPRIAYVMTTMMEAVVNNGTGLPVRQRYTGPAAGKTGSSHDAWFAGYTSDLICVVWVGYDDYSDLKLAGGTTAAPIWGEFMKRATKVPGYDRPRGFNQPDGVVDVKLDKNTNLLATNLCSTDTYTAAFVAGTEPYQTCEQVTADQRNVLQRIFGIGDAQPVPAPPVTPGGQQLAVQPGQPAPAQGQAQPEKKKGFFGRIFGVFKGDDDDKDKKSSEPNRAPPPAQQSTNGQRRPQ